MERLMELTPWNGVGGDISGLVFGQTPLGSVKCTRCCHGGMVGLLGLRGAAWCCAGGDTLRRVMNDVWQLARCPLLALQAHFNRFLDNNELTTLPATVFSDLSALQQL